MRLPELNDWAKFVLVALIGAGTASMLYGDTIVATYAPAGTQTPDTTTLCGSDSVCWIGEQQFLTSSVPAAGNFPTLISTGGAGAEISGTYTGGLVIYSADQYGGAGGSGYYPELFASGGSYAVALTTSGGLPGVNYFGMWFSALDAGNELQFYNGSTLLYTFTPALFASLVGACPNATNAFCGNPNNKTEDSGEQFAFLNFYDTNGYFDQVVFTESGGGGFESDNHTVGYMNPVVPTGTPIVTPEPGSLALMLTGLLALIGLRCRFALKN
jgi:hypothetical protein